MFGIGIWLADAMDSLELPGNPDHYEAREKLTLKHDKNNETSGE